MSRFVANIRKAVNSKSPERVSVQSEAEVEPIGSHRKSATLKLIRYHRTDFQVGSMVGQGSFATVYKAREIASGLDVALKIVRPESELDIGPGPNGTSPDVSYDDVLKAMKLEIQHIESVGPHPNVIRIIGTAEDCRVFVMERAAVDLYNLVKKQPNLPLSMVKRWSRNILEAVAHIHEMGVVHQDIKSSNILIFQDREAKICDFGLARKLDESMVVDRELVTLWYRPPELLMGASSYTAKVDEWGVGCVVLEMMTGASPFKGRTEHTCSCEPVTHRNYNGDQLMKIFAMLGTPRDRDFVASMACATHFAKWPVFPRRLEATVQRACSAERMSWGRGVSPEDGEILELGAQWALMVGGLLSIDPRQRFSARRALSREPLAPDRPIAPPAGPAGASPAARSPAAAVSAAGGAGAVGGAAPPQSRAFRRRIGSVPNAFLCAAAAVAAAAASAVGSRMSSDHSSAASSASSSSQPPAAAVEAASAASAATTATPASRRLARRLSDPGTGEFTPSPPGERPAGGERMPRVAAPGPGRTASVMTGAGYAGAGATRLDSAVAAHSSRVQPASAAAPPEAERRNSGHRGLWA